MVDLVAWLICAQGRIGLGWWSWQNLAEFGGLGRIWQNAVENGILPANCRHIAVDCGSLVVGL